MQPQQPSAPTPTPSPTPNPYEFIMNPANQQAPKSKLPFNTGSPKGKIFMILGLGLVVIVVLLLGVSLLGGSKDSAGDSLLVVLQEQTELVRVANLANNQARQANTLSLSNNVQLSVASAQQQLLPLAKKRGIKADAKILALKQNSNTDKKLTAAAENGQFDTVFTQTMSEQLGAYKNSLNSVYGKISSQKDKAIIKSAYDGSALLLTSVQSN